MKANFNFSHERFSEEIAKIGTAKEIAAMAGISEQSLSSLKRGKSKPSNQTLAKIKSTYPSFDPVYIMTGSKSEEEPLFGVPMEEENRILRQKITELEGKVQALESVLVRALRRKKA